MNNRKIKKQKKLARRLKRQRKDRLESKSAKKAYISLNDTVSSTTYDEILKDGIKQQSENVNKLASYYPDLGMYFLENQDSFNKSKKINFAFNIPAGGTLAKEPEGHELTIAIVNPLFFTKTTTEHFCATFRFDKATMPFEMLNEQLKKTMLVNVKFIELCNQYTTKEGEHYIPILCQLREHNN